MRNRVHIAVTALILALLATVFVAPGSGLQAQTLPRLFEQGRPGAPPAERPALPHQTRKARLKLETLNVPAFVLNLFDNAERVVHMTSVEHPAEGRFVWHGRTDDNGLVTFAGVNGAVSGTVFLDGRSFEITTDADGEQTIAELNAAAAPLELDPIDEPVFDTAGDGTTSGATTATDGTVEIDMLVVWTPAARSAAGGTANIESLVAAAVANANLSYSNALVPARLRLVHAAEVAFTEAPSNMSGDLSALRGTTDGRADEVHSLRNQYGADIVSLIGNGYASAGYCGLGYLMSSPSTSFASYAFNIVDRTCAAGYLSFAHEVGHNQGLHHDPGNAGSTPSYPYAYGYQDPGNVFRTVLSYGGATRVPYLSNPNVVYNGRVTGTSSQDNARALTNNLSIVSAFRSTSTSSTTPSCSFSVSPTSLGFTSSGGSATVSVTTTSGCSWTSSSGSSWASVSGSGSGSGFATVTVASNSGGGRSASVTVAGKTVSVSQEAAPASACSYSVTPTSLSFTSTGGTATLSVTTTAGCAWSSSSSLSWATAAGASSGSGSATVTVASTTGGNRSGSVTVAGKTVSLSQSGATKGGKGGGKKGGDGATSPGGGNKK